MANMLGLAERIWPHTLDIENPKDSIIQRHVSLAIAKKYGHPFALFFNITLQTR